MLSYYRVRKFVSWIVEKVEEIERSKGKTEELSEIKSLCIEFCLALAYESETRHSTSYYKREWKSPRI